MSKIAKVKPYTIENGDGIRVSIFFSGCEHYCKNCFNSELWDFDVGETFSREYYENKIKPLIKDYINGLTILGGEPLHHKNLFATYRLVKWFKNDFPDKTIWIYTGYDFEYLLSLQYSLETSKFIRPDCFIKQYFIRLMFLLMVNLLKKRNNYDWLIEDQQTKELLMFKIFKRK